MAVIASIQVGRPRERGTEGAADPMDRPWFSAFVKDPVTGPIALGTINLEGDDQADRVNHGGVDKAVLLYSSSHYPLWRAELGLPEIPHGGWGENFTIDGQAEPDVCIGDVYRMGDAVVQVSQPRQPCWKLARRWRIKTLVVTTQNNGRTGWYCRVLKTGTVAPGDALEPIERPNPDWTISRANRIMHIDKRDLDAAAALAAVPELSANWKATLGKRAAKQEEVDPRRRLEGPDAR